MMEIHILILLLFSTTSAIKFKFVV